LLEKIKPELGKAEDRLPGVITESVLEQLVRIGKLPEDIDQLDRRLVALGKTNTQMQVLQTIPGIGPLTATRWFPPRPISIAFVAADSSPPGSA
jgi:transposase